MQKIIVAIDGYAATGKSSQAKRLAKTLGYTYIDTGAMYRAITYFALQQEPKGTLNFELLVAALDTLQINFKNTDLGQQTFLNQKDISQAIREPEVTSKVSEVARIPEVRAFLVEQQRALGKKKGIVMDGRDIGTVVFPDAECKFFLTATPEVRAKRRHLEQVSSGNQESYEAVLSNIHTRDQMDSSRATAPLKKAADAIELDVSELTIDEVYERLIAYILKKTTTL
jgi:cytidylate kinase